MPGINANARMDLFLFINRLLFNTQLLKGVYHLVKDSVSSH